jgi:hypothetical protein
LLLHRLPKKTDSALVRLGHFLRLGSERNQVRQEIKSFLKDQGIELTADIRKALPSRFNTGNAKALWTALKEAPIEEKFVVKSFGNSLENLDWGDISKAKSLSRDSSLGATAPARLGSIDFKSQAKTIADAAKTAGNLQEPTLAGPRPGNALCLTISGWTTEDQREESLNYLHLAYVSQTEAEDAISFLAQNGLDTFALYVDPQQVRGNNFSPTRPFKLYASKGITSDEYSKKMTAKTNVEAAVARLGPRWQKERKGSSNFSKPAWEKK